MIRGRIGVMVQRMVCKPMSEQWTERLQCPRCHATGEATLYQRDDEEVPRAAILRGFVMTRAPDAGLIFYCAIAGRLRSRSSS